MLRVLNKIWNNFFFYLNSATHSWTIDLDWWYCTSNKVLFILFVIASFPIPPTVQSDTRGRVPSTGQCGHQRGLWHWHRPHLFGLTSDDRPWDQRWVALLWDGPKDPGERQRTGGGGHTRGYGGSHSHDYTVPQLLCGIWNPLGTSIWTGALWEERLLPG